MGIYKFYSCPKCRKSLESFVPQGSKGIGEPFLLCPNCGAYVIMKELCNEWELMSKKEKYGIKLRAAWTGIYMGGGGGLTLGALTGHFFLKEFINKSDLNAAVAIGLPAIIFAIGYYSYLKKFIEKEIEKSNSRMQDPAYKAILKNLNLLN